MADLPVFVVLALVGLVPLLFDFRNLHHHRRRRPPSHEDSATTDTAQPTVDSATLRELQANAGR